jgi:hypothetical protein
LDLTINSITAEIQQSGDMLYALIAPTGILITANWYNQQGEDVWLMESNSHSFNPRFDCSYFIVAEDANGCIDTSDVYYHEEVASSIGQLMTSPNPTDGMVNVKFDNQKHQFVTVRLVNTNGDILQEYTTTDQQMNLDISNYPSGSYFIYFTSGKETLTNKIILNK